MSLTRRLPAAALLAGAAALGGALPHDAAATHTRHTSLSQLVTQPLQPRDLYSLTDQLRLRPPRPIARVVRTTSPNYPVGHQDTFQVLSEDQNRYFTMRATIVARAPHIYIYVQNGTKVDVSAAQSTVTYFEKHIYPTDHAAFGSEWNPGVDGDPHITCLVGDLRSAAAAGYFSAEDEFPHLVNPWSNQREMVYMNSTATLPGDSSFRQILAHEFQHMIHWHMHPRDNAWLNEGMSMLAENLNHFPPSGEASSFDSSPTTQLDTWSLDDASTIPHYGGAYLFLQYIYDRFGPAVIKSIVADKRYTDLQVVDIALKQHHIHVSARQVFTDWVIANWLDDRSLAGGRYGFKSVSYKVTSSVGRSLPFSSRWSIPPWAAQYVVLDSLSGQKPFRLSFSAPTTVPVVSFSHAAGSWWSNRGDMSQTSLQRPVDLRHVKHATLTFSTMYDIEKDYDYAYVEASTDGGKTWSTLRGTHTTTANPNGASFGNAYTGTTRGWLQESVDLSRYAGHRIRLRFQYLTDDEYNGQGQVIANIRIPEIGYHDDGTGWAANGFVHLDTNSLPSQWTVQIISYTDKGISVSRLPVSGARGSITIDPSRNGLKKLVIVTFSTAPKTTVRSTYTLSTQASG